MTNRMLIGLLAIVIIVGAVVVFARRNSTPADTTSSTQEAPADTADTTDDTSSEVVAASPTPTATTTASSNTQSTVKSFTVTGSNYKFSPTEIKVKKGDTVKITFKSSGGMHDLMIDEFDVATKELDSGEQETVEFVANQTGSFEYYCSVGNHRAMGMKGTLVVE